MIQQGLRTPPSRAEMWRVCIPHRPSLSAPPPHSPLPSPPQCLLFVVSIPAMLMHAEEVGGEVPRMVATAAFAAYATAIAAVGGCAAFQVGYPLPVSVVCVCP